MIKEIGGGLLGIGLNAYNRKQQNKQQGEFNKQQIRGAKELSDYEKKNQLDIWNKTNYSEQVEQMNKAGINPALLYGMGGTGGATTGGGSGAMPTAGVAEAPSAGGKNAMDMALMAAQTKVMESQAKKNDAEATESEVRAEKTAGTDTIESEERTRGNKFDNDLKERIGVEKFERSASSELDAKEALSRKERYAVEAWERVMYTNEKGENVSDDGKISEESRIYKNLVDQYRKAKSEANLSQAEEVIKQWSTELIKDGMPPDSPWYYKLIERFINNASGGKLNLKDAGKALYKQSQNNELGDKIKNANYGR